MVYNKNGPKHQGRKGRYVGTHWYDDIVVIDDDRRVMPHTVPHHVVAEHEFPCQCVPCTQYPQDLLWELKWKHRNPGKRYQRS